MGIFNAVKYSSGSFGDFLDFSGAKAAEAQRRAAELQFESTQAGVAEQRAAREQARADLSPFREEGVGALEGLASLIQDPNAQSNFANNEFFGALAGDAQQRLSGAGFGGISNEAMQNANLLLSPELLNQNISQRFNLATLGANAAGGQATATLGTNAQITDLITQGGNAQAAGLIGAQNARTRGLNDALQIGSAFYNR